jgi:PAS domain S-box-containing protein
MEIPVKTKNKAELQQIPKLQEKIIEFLPDATFVVDKESKVIAWNKAIEDMTGTCKKDILGKGNYAYAIPLYGERRPTLVDFILKKTSQIPQGLYDYVEKKVESIIAEVFIPSIFGGNGGYVWGKASPFFDDNGNIIGAIEILRHITEEKHAEQTRIRYLNFLEIIEKIDKTIKETKNVESLLDNILKQVWEILDCDRAFLFYPCDPDAKTFILPFIQSKPEYPWGFEHGAELELIPEIAGGLRRALNSEKAIRWDPESDEQVPKRIEEIYGPKSILYIAKHPKIGPPWLLGLQQVSHARVWSEEDLNIFEEIARRTEDAINNLLFIRELASSEEHHKSISKIITDYSYSYLVEANQNLTLDWEFGALQRITGYTSEEIKTMGGWASLIYPEDKQIFQNQLNLLLERQVLSNTVQYRIITKSGKLKWITDYGKSTFDEKSHKVTYIYGALQDITERKKAYLALQESEKKFRDLISSIPLGILSFKHDKYNRLILIDSNPAADDILNIETRKLVGQTIEDALPNIIKTDIPDKFRLIASKKQIWHTAEFTFPNIPANFEMYAFQTAPGKMALVFRKILKTRKTPKTALK